jgi:hypothetical protein
MLTTRRDTLAVLAALAISLTGVGSMLLADHCGVFHCCPDCGHKQCCPTPAMVKEKKTIYSCECKDICIPGVKGPFAPCCEAPSCGRVRTIKVLRKMEIECEHCGYKWEVRSVGCQSCK